MTKEMKDILAKMTAKLDDIKAAEADKADSLMKEYESLKADFERQKAVYEAEKAVAAMGADLNPLPEAKKAADKKNGKDIFAKQIRAVLKPGAALEFAKDLSATEDANGGYTVPEDVLTTINKYKEAYTSLESEITVVPVSAVKGSRVFQSRGRAGAFSKLTSNGLGYQANTTDPEANKVTNPTFTQLTYAIEDYAGFMPVPNNLIEDSDANITAVVSEWLGKAAVDTDNAEILDLLGQSGASGMGTGWTDLANIDGIKKAVNVTLGQAFAPTAKIYTNDDGAQYLATLKEKTDSNKPLLNPVITDPAKAQLSVGFRAVPVVVLPNETLKSIAATSAAGGKIPMIIGDLKEAVVKFDRKGMTIDASNVATIGGSNAFAKNMTLFRAIMRADYKLRDSAAVVKGYISTPKASA